MKYFKEWILISADANYWFYAPSEDFLIYFINEYPSGMYCTEIVCSLHFCHYFIIWQKWSIWYHKRKMPIEICGPFAYIVLPVILRSFFHLAMFNNYAKDPFQFTARSCHLSCVFRSLYADIANNWRLIVNCYITCTVPILQMKSGTYCLSYLYEEVLL